MGKNKIKGIFVTGAGGFVGGHLCKYLEKTDIVFYKNTTDLHNLNELRKTLERIDIDTIVHMAGGFGDDINDLFDVNVKLTQNLCNAMEPKQIQRVIFTSTGAVYGAPLNGIESYETDIPYPDTPYGIMKLTAEHVLRYILAQKGIVSIILRLPNIYGNGGKGIVNKLLHDISVRKIVNLNGDGKKSRDFASIDSVVDIICELALTYQFNSTIYNMPSQVRLSVNDLLSIFAKYFKFSKDIHPDDTTTHALHMNADKINKQIQSKNYISIEDYISSSFM